VRKMMNDAVKKFPCLPHSFTDTKISGKKTLGLLCASLRDANLHIRIMDFNGTALQKKWMYLLKTSNSRNFYFNEIGS
jgi:hypothetical protein